MAEILYARLDRRPTSAEARQRLERFFQEARLRQSLDWSHWPKLAWHWQRPADPTQPAWAVALAASDLMTTPDMDLVRACDNIECRWLFLDTSKNHTRRWCSMSACGNRAKAAAWRAAKTLRDAVENQVKFSSTASTVSTWVEQYRVEKMPRRAMTRQGYNTWLNQYIIPKWGKCSIQELQARPVDLWLQSLTLAPKSKVHIRGLVRIMWDFAMWRGDVPVQRNPMELVAIKGATKRTRNPVV